MTQRVVLIVKAMRQYVVPRYFDPVTCVLLILPVAFMVVEAESTLAKIILIAFYVALTSESVIAFRRKMNTPRPLENDQKQSS
jgi:hypothetical protein